MTEGDLSAQDREKFRTGTKKRAIACAIVYGILFPFACKLFLFDPFAKATEGFAIWGLLGVVPLCIPVSIYFAWARYRRQQYLKCRLFCLLPFVAFAVLFPVVAMLFRS